MSYRGHVEDGVVVLDDDVHLPEGMAVNIEPATSTSMEPVAENIPTLFERLRPFVGAVEGLPSDLVKNHDHYLHGAAKKS